MRWNSRIGGTKRDDTERGTHYLGYKEENRAKELVMSGRSVKQQVSGQKHPVTARDCVCGYLGVKYGQCKFLGMMILFAGFLS